MNKLVLLAALSLPLSLLLNAEPATITNNTHRTLTITSDKQTIKIKPEETKSIEREGADFTMQFQGHRRALTKKFSSQAKSFSINAPLSDFTITEHAE